MGMWLIFRGETAKEREIRSFVAGSGQIPVLLVQQLAEEGAGLCGLLVGEEIEIATRNAPCEPRVGLGVVAGDIAVLLEAHEVEETIAFKSGFEGVLVCEKRFHSGNFCSRRFDGAKAVTLPL